MIRFFLLCFVAAVPLLAGCAGQRLPVDIPGITGPKVTDEQLIAQVLDDVHRGMQSRRIYKVLAHVSRSYHDGDGRDYAGVENYLNTLFQKYRVIRIKRVPPRIAVQGDRARVVETYGTIAEPVNAAEDPPISLQGQITVYLEKVGGVWRITQWAHS